MSRSLNALAAIAGLAGIAGGGFLAFGLQGPGDALQKQVAAEVADADLQIEATRTRMEDLKLQIREADNQVVEINLGDPLPQSIDVSLGRKALVQEVASWDIDIRPDGTGLPVGSGDVWTGEEVFAEQCAACHGDFGEAVGRWPVLAGGHDTLDEEDPVKTIGSYWPYLSTVYDYINRAMPFGYAQSLSHDDVYAITAYLLYVNDLVDDDFELNQDNFRSFRLPNEENFYFDDRASTEYVAFAGEPCMNDCKPEVEITARAMVVDVTPEEEEIEVASIATDTGGGNDDGAALIAAGEKVFRKCSSCHAIGAGAKHKSGPLLTGVMGRTMGGVEGFSFSGIFQTAASEGRVWDDAAMAAFLAKPKEYMPGTKMGFGGLKDDADVQALVAYLKEAE